MSNLKFIYDEEDIKDVKILYDKDDEKSRETMDTIKMMCIDTIPEDLEPVVTEEEGAYIISSNNGELVLKHISSFIYLLEEFVKKAGDKLSDVIKDKDEKSFKDYIGEEIEWCAGVGYQEIFDKIGVTRDDD